MDQANEPLARRLREAALDRNADSTERVDDFVLDETGVLDLRELDRDPLGSSVADPAKALSTIRGRLGDAHEVGDLYADSEPQRSRWRLGLRARHTFGEDLNASVDTIDAPEAPAEPTPIVEGAPQNRSSLPPLSRLSLLPLAEELPAPTVEPQTEPVADPDVIDLGIVDLNEADRPTADCPKCLGTGRRDLFDRFSQVEFYSCDNCMHMWQQDRR